MKLNSKAIANIKSILNESDEVNELSKQTLVNYVDKATSQLSEIEDADKFVKRVQGISKASAKLRSMVESDFTNMGEVLNSMSVNEALELVSDEAVDELTERQFIDLCESVDSYYAAEAKQAAVKLGPDADVNLLSSLANKPKFDTSWS